MTKEKRQQQRLLCRSKEKEISFKFICRILNASLWRWKWGWSVNKLKKTFLLMITAKYKWNLLCRLCFQPIKSKLTRRSFCQLRKLRPMTVWLINIKRKLNETRSNFSGVVTLACEVQYVNVIFKQETIYSHPGCSKFGGRWQNFNIFWGKFK